MNQTHPAARVSTGWKKSHGKPTAASTPSSMIFGCYEAQSVRVKNALIGCLADLGISFAPHQRLPIGLFATDEHDD
ncbi:hypothetical protein IG631_23286 [Alternaria alternata]|jgi:hypothetical protein|nr:hypothetical protein IG631_23286 [Alternaria alternata]